MKRINVITCGGIFVLGIRACRSTGERARPQSTLEPAINNDALFYLTAFIDNGDQHPEISGYFSALRTLKADE